MINARGVLAILAFGGVALAACSSNTKSSEPAGGGGGGGGSANTVVAERNVSGAGPILTDSSGKTLYMSDQEMSGKLVCTTSECTTFWTPLTVKSGQPTGPSDVSAKLSTVTRPDGSKQVAFNGAPLYTFSFDHAAGDLKGNNFKDTFDGVNFKWQAATANGAAAPAPPSSSSDDSGYGNGY